MTTLTEHLASHDAACPRCGHALHGLHADRCPECGSALELGVVRPHPGRGWTLTLIGLSMGFGQGLMVCIYFGLILISGGVLPMWLPACFALLALWSGVVLAFVLRRERAWVRLPGRARSAVAALAVVFGLVLPAGLMAVAAFT